MTPTRRNKKNLPPRRRGAEKKDNFKKTVDIPPFSRAPQRGVGKHAGPQLSEFIHAARRCCSISSTIFFSTSRYGVPCGVPAFWMNQMSARAQRGMPLERRSMN